MDDLEYMRRIARLQNQVNRLNGELSRLQKSVCEAAVEGPNDQLLRIRIDKIIEYDMHGKRIGEVGEITTFDPHKHECILGWLQPDRRVKILRSGVESEGYAIVHALVEAI